MKHLIIFILCFISTITSTSSMEKKFFLSYGERVYELRTFKMSIISSVPKVHQKKLAMILDDILINSAKYKVDPILVIATIWTESQFNDPKYQISSANARGAMQVLPTTGKYVFNKLLKKNGEIDLHNSSQNIEIGVAYLAHLIKMFNGNEQHAVISYNMGPKYVLDRKIKKFNHRYYNVIKSRFDQITNNLDRHKLYIKITDIDLNFSDLTKYKVSYLR